MSEVPDNITRLLRKTYPSSYTVDSLAAQLKYTSAQVSEAVNKLLTYKMIVAIESTIDNGSGVQIPVVGAPVQYRATFSSNL